MYAECHIFIVIVMLSIVMHECQHAECCYAECRHAECCYAERGHADSYHAVYHSVESHYAESCCAK
jgi:hypothetical protein